MRVTLLAATMICIAATAAGAQPSKTNPLRPGTDTGSSQASMLGPASLTVEIPVVEPIDSGNAHLSELKPQTTLAKIKEKGLRVQPIKEGNIHLAKIDFDLSIAAQITSADAQLSKIETPAAPAAQLRSADMQPRKMNPEPSPLLPIIYVSLQPSKMNPADVAGLTGAMRYADSPWLDRAINDLGTNPTGWKRLWCARSLNLWLQQSGKRGCGGDTAISCLEAGRRLPEPQVGAIAVMKHHVGIVKEINDRHVVLVSGNNRGRPGARTVGVSKYSRARVVGYVWPE